MKEILLMAVDLGTSFIKAGIYNTDSQCVAEAMEPVKDYRPKPGIFIQKGDELFDSVIACMKSVCEELGDRAQNIEAISFTGQMSGFMGVSKDWDDITTWSCSLDSRYMPYADRQMATLKDKFLEIGGTNFPALAPKYEWFKTEFPEEAKKIAKYLMISGYVIGRLGKVPIEDAVMDRSYASWTGLADIRHDQWSDEICDAIGLDRKYLPKIVNSNFICGHLDKEWADIVGMKAGIPLVSGAGDKVAGCLGSATVEHGEMVFEASSYGEISCCVEEYRPDMEEGRLDVLCSAIPGEFYATHFAAGSGITLDWFVNSFSRKPGEDLGEAFRRIETDIQDIAPGCDGLMSIGLCSGSSMPSDGVLRGMFMGFDWSHKPEHFYRSLIESFTYDFALAMRSIDRLYPEYDLSKVKIIGGGAKSPVWKQASADATGKTYCTISRKDVSMWGASILAGNAIGVFPDLKETAKKYVHECESSTPNPDMKAFYAKRIDLYAAYLKELRGFYQRIQDLDK
jgi:xylulokinase